jgi:hypothetical protein
MAGGEKHIEALVLRAISTTLRNLIGRIGTMFGPRFSISACDDLALMGILNQIAPFCCDFYALGCNGSYSNIAAIGCWSVSRPCC